MWRGVLLVAGVMVGVAAQAQPGEGRPLNRLMTKFDDAMSEA
jgi:hypothetical protein